MNRPSKRHKGNDYYDDDKPSELQRQMRLLEEYEEQEESKQFAQAQQQLEMSPDDDENDQNVNKPQGFNPGSDDDSEDLISIDDMYEGGIISNDV